MGTDTWPEFGVALVADGPRTDAVITTKNERTNAGTANDLKPTRTGVLFTIIGLPPPRRHRSDHQVHAEGPTLTLRVPHYN
jgi:hypothetical protein